MRDTWDPDPIGADPHDGSSAGDRWVPSASAPIEEVDERVATLYRRVRGDEREAPEETAGSPLSSSFVGRPGRPDADVPPGRLDAGEPPPPAPRRHHRIWIPVTAAAVVVVAACLAGFEWARPGGSDSATDLTTAVRTTTQSKTADVAMSITINGTGSGITIVSDGDTSFVSDASNLDISYESAPTGGRPVTERAVIDGSTGYYNVGAAVGEIDPGKSWISEDLSPSGSGPIGSGAGASGATSGGVGGGIFDNPSSLLAVLGTPGTAVQSLGTADVDGAPVQQYALALGPAGIRRAVASEQLPGSMKAELSAIRFQTLEYRVAVDGTHHLRQVRTTGAYTVAGEHFTLASTMNLSAYGTPVQVSPPPADQVVPLPQLEQLESRDQGQSIA